MIKNQLMIVAMIKANDHILKGKRIKIFNQIMFNTIIVKTNRLTLEVHTKGFIYSFLFSMRYSIITFNMTTIAM
ncbi:hypothetical protein SDC9_189373 [bioreactor metagenome]|uniref:Uncharacterized protein n=1 Tax=bioreactor metagenome TaxID=1076179 RepID=A0A645HRY1_9ZZZZ